MTEKIQVFLATTALEEFWDTSKPIIFIGEGCRLNRRRLFWKQLNGTVLKKSPGWIEGNRDDYLYKREIYERGLPLLGEFLNAIHGVNYSTRSWRIIIGPWLYFYITVVYDRYLHVKSALEQYPDFTTIVLSEKSFVVPADTYDFFFQVSEDPLNLQIYSKILAALGKKYTSRDLLIAESLPYREMFNVKWTSKVIDIISKMYALIGSKITPLVLMKNSYFNKKTELMLMLKTRGRAVPLRVGLAKLSSLELDSAIRRRNDAIDLGDSEFEKCLSEMMLSDIPKCFVEGFHCIKSAARKSYPKKARAIFSANSWYQDEAFKLWAAESAEKGTLLLGTQHGGNYGGMINMFWEDHETAIVDIYYTWGWMRSDSFAKVIPMPASKLMNRKKNIVNYQHTGILWVATANTRFLYDSLYCSDPDALVSYFTWQRRFAETLFPGIVAVCRLRAHRDDHDWDVAGRLREYVSDLQLETWDVPILESLKNCRLYICDHFSTTFVEALSANIPTILFWNPQHNEVRSEAQPYFDLLCKNGILFYSPEEAATTVNKVYHKVQIWWNEPGRQAAVKAFCGRFARVSQDAIDLWANEFKGITTQTSEVN